MSNLNLFDNYFPVLKDIPESAALNARQRLTTYTQAGWPELDMRPNTPFGDLHLTPFAYLMAGMEIAMERFRSDLVLENVANGIVYDCEFVKKFLGNFAVNDSDQTESSGVIRLTFNTDKEYTLDLSTLFGFGNDYFRVYSPNPGGVLVRRVGDPITAGSNDVTLIDRADGTFIADVAVVGTMTSDVLAGESGSIAPLPPELMSIIALVDFVQGVGSSSLSAQASKSRKTVYASSNGTPGGITRFINKEFPGLVSTSVVVSGDKEMMRDSVNPLGFSDGRMDIYARSHGYAFSDKQTVRLFYSESAQRYITKLSLSGQPYMLNGITDLAGTKLSVDAYEIYSRSSNGGVADMAAAAYSDLEELYLVVNLPTDNNGVPVIDIRYDYSGDAYIDVVVDFRADPVLPAIKSATTGRDNSPIGTNILVRGFIPVVFTRFVVHYTRRAGTSVNIDTAREEVFNYVNSVGYPDAFSEAKLHDGVFLAGAHDVVDVEAVGVVKWSIANYFLSSTDPSPTEDYAGCVASRRTPPRISLPNLRALRTNYRDPAIGTSEQTNVAFGMRNLTFVIDKDQITFSETKDQ